MSKDREFRQHAKTVLLEVLKRAGRLIKRMRKTNPRYSSEDAWKAVVAHGYHGDRAQWKRWYKANKKHQARMRAIRQRGGQVGNMPHSLCRGWVP